MTVSREDLIKFNFYINIITQNNKKIKRKKEIKMQNNGMEFKGHLSINENREFEIENDFRKTNLTNVFNGLLTDVVEVTIRVYNYNPNCPASEKFKGTLLRKNLFTINDWNLFVDDICLDEILMAIAQNTRNHITISIEVLGNMYDNEGEDEI